MSAIGQSFGAGSQGAAETSIPYIARLEISVRMRMSSLP
jgi:hypothetical protein